MPELSLNVGGKYERKAVNRAVTGGSAPSNGIVLSENAARHNFKIASDAGGWFIEDLAERENVLVNEIPVLRKYLCNRDEISVGEDTITFFSDEPGLLLLLWTSDGVRPASPDELPAMGPWAKKQYAAESIRGNRLLRNLRKLAILSMAAALCFAAYAISLPGPTEPEYDAGALEAADLAMQFARDNRLADAASLAAQALERNIPSYRKGELQVLVSSYLRARNQEMELQAAKARDAAEVIARYPGTTSYANAMYELMDARIAGKMASDVSARESWEKANADAKALAGQGALWEAAMACHRYARASDKSVYLPAAKAAAWGYLTGLSARIGHLYDGAGAARGVEYRFSDPSSMTDWRTESGEWESSEGGLKGGQGVQEGRWGALLINTNREYTCRSVWLRSWVARAPGSIFSLGLRRNDGYYLAIRVAERGSVSWAMDLDGADPSFQYFEVPSGGVICIEMAVIEGRGYLYVNGSKAATLGDYYGLTGGGGPLGIKPVLSLFCGYPFIASERGGSAFLSFEMGW
ncbi:MAG: FHA domain-containing protein [Candidatus Brocadiia bacterium]